MNTNTFSIVDHIEYWESPNDGAVADGHTLEARQAASKLLRAGGPWDEEILGPRPADHPMTWAPVGDSE